MPRAQSIVLRDSKILMVKHSDGDSEWWCLPGGGILDGETSQDAALRELQEECTVAGMVLRPTSTWTDAIGETHFTFLVDIGSQQPQLGHDPELGTRQILCDAAWLELHEIPERDRAFLWAGGLVGIDAFVRALELCGNAISWPASST